MAFASCWLVVLVWLGSAHETHNRGHDTKIPSVRFAGLERIGAGIPPFRINGYIVTIDFTSRLSVLLVAAFRSGDRLSLELYSLDIAAN